MDGSGGSEWRCGGRKVRSGASQNHFRILRQRALSRYHLFMFYLHCHHHHPIYIHHSLQPLTHQLPTSPTSCRSFQPSTRLQSTQLSPKVSLDPFTPPTHRRAYQPIHSLRHVLLHTFIGPAEVADTRSTVNAPQSRYGGGVGLRTCHGQWGEVGSVTTGRPT